MPDPFAAALADVRQSPPPVDPFDAAVDAVRAGAPADARSTFARIVDRLNQPFLPQISAAANAAAEFLSRPRLIEAQLNDAIPGFGTLSAMTRGGVAGAIQGAGDVLGS